MPVRLVFAFLCCIPSLWAQTELNYPKVVYGPGDITAEWVTHPDLDGDRDVTVLFRNVFEVEDAQAPFIINISADNHYFLYVNGELVVHGPQLSDIRHWKYETLDIQKFLKKGKNIMAVKVVNFGKRRFLGMQSIFTTLMVNGVTENAKPLTTSRDNKAWKCFIDPSYKAIEVNWRGGGDENNIIGGFYANNPTDFVDMNHYPKRWKQLDFDDSKWQPIQFFEGASSMGGSIAYLLEPRNLPLLTWEDEALGSVVRVSDPKLKTAFPVSGSLALGAGQDLTVLIDQGYVTNGFPELVFSGGKGAEITLKYAENLFDSNGGKGDRNVIEGKELVGYKDVIISSGASDQDFVPNWMRTFRFVQIEVKGGQSPLVLQRFVNHRSRSSIPSVAAFESDNPLYDEIFDICKRTVDICTQDYFMSDAYYETMQYVGDTKIHALLWLAMSGNLDYMRHAIRQFHHSRLPEGDILGAYPLRSTFVYPTYSLVWVDMIADYYNITGDKTIIEEFKNGMVHTIDGFEKNLRTDHLVGPTPYRYFIDWYTNPENGGGTALKNDGDGSAVVSLHYAHALLNAARLFKAVDEPYFAERFAARAETIKASVNDLCYDADRQEFAENPNKSIYDQHTNIMAILTNTLPKEGQRALLEKVLNDASLLQATYYYRFYLFKAIEKVNASELFDVAQKPWEQMIADHMTTTLERFESATKPTRSEVHPWSASPAYFYLTYLAGIQSVENAFEKIKVAPTFGVLKEMKGILPTPHGAIRFDMKRKKGTLTATLTLPENVRGTLVWDGEERSLNPGNGTYELKAKN